MSALVAELAARAADQSLDVLAVERPDEPAMAVAATKRSVSGA